MCAVGAAAPTVGQRHAFYLSVMIAEWIVLPPFHKLESANEHGNDSFFYRTVDPGFLIMVLWY